MPVDSADTLQVKKFDEIALSHSVSEINTFLHFTKKFKMAAKSGGENDFSEKSPVDSKYPVGQKFHRNCSISLRFRDKRAFAFKAEIQDGRQKWRENDFSEKSPVDSKYSVGQKFRRNCSISLHFQDKRVFAFKAEIQDGRQKWRENDFWEKLKVDSADTLRVKNFVEIALSRSVSEINAFLHFMQKFKMAAKSGGRTIFAKSCQ